MSRKAHDFCAISRILRYSAREKIAVGIRRAVSLVVTHHRLP